MAILQKDRGFCRYMAAMFVFTVQFDGLPIITVIRERFEQGYFGGILLGSTLSMLVSFAVPKWVQFLTGTHPPLPPRARLVFRQRQCRSADCITYRDPLVAVLGHCHPSSGDGRRIHWLDFGPPRLRPARTGGSIHGGPRHADRPARTGGPRHWSLGLSHG